MKVSEAVALYIKLRDEKAAMKAEFEAQVAPLNERLDQLEAKLMEVMEITGSDSLKCQGIGTAYASVRTSASVADREVFIEHVKKNDDWGLLEVRAAKAGVETYKESHDGQLPPGVNWREERTVNVRRA